MVVGIIGAEERQLTSFPYGSYQLTVTSINLIDDTRFVV